MTAEELPIEAVDPVESNGEEKRERERSTIQFPYLALDEAVLVAKAIHEVAGTSCELDQLAGQMKQSPASSMFKLRLSTARIFGLVTNSHGTVSLTPLGTRICDPQQEQTAKADAFLTVPLYKQVYEQFKGASLPPAGALETVMGNLGVAPKQKSNARQVFQRSATQAGFFAFGPTRLVYPPAKAAASIQNPPESKSDIPEEKPAEKLHGKRNGGGGGGDDGEELHPFIKGLITTLPTPKMEWPIEARKKWLQAASNIFDLIYESPDDSRGSLRIEVQKDSAK